MKNDPVYTERFNCREAELKQLYQALYPNQETAYKALCGALESYAAGRSAELQELDAWRESDPNWYKSNRMLGMCLYVGAFAKNLDGVRKKLPYLRECGVNYLHLMPLLESPRGRSDGGYAVADFRTVQPGLGTMADLSELATACHHNGVSVCMDFVMNHTSEDHEWAKKARAGDKTYQDYYFFYDDRTIPDEYEKHVPEVFPTTAPGNFTELPELHKYVLTTFYPYQWDLNYRNPAVFNAMTENMLYLANRGIDILRIDAVPYIWKQLGTNCRNLPEVHTIVRMLRLITEIVCPGTLLLGEVVMAPDKLAPYFGPVDRPECHMLYNATTMCTTWHTVATRDVRLLRRQIDSVSALPRQWMFLNYLRCHDDIGWGLDYPWLSGFGMSEVPHKKYLNDFFTGRFPGSWSCGELYNDDPRLGDARLCGTTASLCGVEKAEKSGDEGALHYAMDLDVMLHAFLLTQTGLPILYSGDEIGRLNDNDYHADPDKREDSRYLHRGDFQWDLAKRRTTPGTVEQELFSRLRYLETLRAAYLAFDANAAVSTFDTGNNAVLGIRRSWCGQTLTALFNFGDYGAELCPGCGEARDLMSGYTVYGWDRRTVPAHGFCWLLEK